MGEQLRTRIAPSLLAADFSCLADEIAEVTAAGADMLHLDLMDGHFVPQLTFGPLVVKGVAATSQIPLDAHLMVVDPDPLIADLLELSVARISVHVESCSHLHRTLASIRDGGAQAGVAINPATPVVALSEVLPWVDFFMLMSVNPGFGGQVFIPESLDKVARLREFIGARAIDITVDGGVSTDNTTELVRAGASTLVAGSSIFGAKDRRSSLRALQEMAKEGETK